MSLNVTAGPHIYSRVSTKSMMRDVVIALLPTSLLGIYFFGVDAALVVLVSIVSAVFAELVWQKVAKKPITINDLSAVVTGLILGLNMPSKAPLWIPAVGSFCAIWLAKQLFGGIGHNFINPAMFARAVLLASWPVHMTRYVLPQRALLSAVAQTGVDTIASATPLQGMSVSISDALIGNIPGAIGEVSKIAILLGFVYLLIRKVISWEVSVSIIFAVALLSYLLGKDPLMSVLTGGVLFGAVFMATDFVTNPMRKIGQLAFGLLCGVIVVVIRQFGNYPEGVTYAILFMNCVTPLIDKFSKKRIYGEGKKNGKK